MATAGAEGCQDENENESKSVSLGSTLLLASCIRHVVQLIFQIILQREKNKKTTMENETFCRFWVGYKRMP